MSLIAIHEVETIFVPLRALFQILLHHEYVAPWQLATVPYPDDARRQELSEASQHSLQRQLAEFAERLSSIPQDHLTGRRYKELLMEVWPFKEVITEQLEPLDNDDVPFFIRRVTCHN